MLFGAEHQAGGTLVLRFRRLAQATPSSVSCACRARVGQPQIQVVSSTFQLEHDRREERFFLAGRLLELTHQEYRLLRLLVEHPRRLLSQKQLLEGAWDDATEGDRAALYSCVKRLRQHLGPARVLIDNQRFGGYRYMPERGCS